MTPAIGGIKMDQIITACMSVELEKEEMVKLLLEIPNYAVQTVDDNTIELHEIGKVSKQVFTINLHGSSGLSFLPALTPAISSHFAKHRIATQLREIGRKKMLDGWEAEMQQAKEDTDNRLLEFQPTLRGKKEYGFSPLAEQISEYFNKHDTLISLIEAGKEKEMATLETELDKDRELLNRLMLEATCIMLQKD